MTAHNAERFVGDALSSVLSQTFADFEIIVVNDGSTDGTWAAIEACRATDNRIRAIDSPHVGRVEALNTACRAAQGEFIAILDADDRSLPHRLERQVNFMRRNPNVALVGCAVIKIGSDGRAFSTVSFPADDQTIKIELACRSPFAHSAVLISREALLDVGWYRPVFDPAEDYDLWLRMSERFQLANLPEALVEYRVHSDQVSSTKIVRHTLAVLGAGVGAELRKKGSHDSTGDLGQITPEFLAAHGRSRQSVQECIVDAFLATSLAQWLSGAPDLSVATLTRALQWAASDQCDARLTARIYSLLASRRLRQGMVFKAIRAFCRAYAANPSEARDLIWRGLMKPAETRRANAAQSVSAAKR